jgi:hypothetical protein
MAKEPKDAFPAGEICADCCGSDREFTFDMLESGSGYFVRATERVPGNDGYSFAAHSESDPYQALGRLRENIVTRPLR